MTSDVTVTPRRVLGLALPALGVLAANPLYLLLDTAVVGRLGTAELAALAAGTAVQSTVTVQLTFLSYGTTARASRLYGAGRRPDAVTEGVQATWVAVAVGMALAALIWLFAQPIALFLTNDPTTAAASARWMHVAAVAIPLTLIIMAGNGWLRGVQNTRLPFILTLSGLVPGAVALPLFVERFGLVGSAWANVLGIGITSALFLITLIREHTANEGSWAPRWGVIRSQLVMGRDLILRSLSFQISMLAAAAVAGRFGVAALAAHQILLQLWNFLTLVLDSLAIAAQTLTGSALGRGEVVLARRVGELATRYSIVFAGVLALAFALSGRVIWSLFTRDAAVVSQLGVAWWMLVAMIVVGGVVFALDGALLGAGDVAFLRTLTIASVLGVFFPVTLAAAAFGWGLPGVWAGLLASVVIRLVGVVGRFRSMKWAIAGDTV
ncbi:MATE family efflux transporter [Corynebacterium lipophiloflavum]|uniref:Probable multidrug resistance protein NorM n=1 Tax=Corynebacterium lipophiloflavum (strain ATCC 700352 / DSM 44291 / CCUG 37336 / JCM 10383 / DMMZ 1944) TaxID=525263 RepID=C0XSE9_CORLD|nr:MATE family efflux transporter [Corynebacterium lipophiloflavum]EEI16801.1 MATE efflux family protein [Corynebacterium lipophiloflavum DSM 44291]